MELVSLKGVALNSKIGLLKELGYDSDGQFVLDSQGKKVLDKYIDLPVEIENMIIMPGSVIILDNNPLSLSKYMEEYEDEF